MLRTILQLKGQGDVDILKTVQEGILHIDSQTQPFNCVVVSKGQASFRVGGRLKALGLSSVILYKHKKWGVAGRQDTTLVNVTFPQTSKLSLLLREFSTLTTRDWWVLRVYMADQG